MERGTRTSTSHGSPARQPWLWISRAPEARTSGTSFSRSTRAVAVVVDAELVIVLGLELELAELARPGADHLVGPEVAPLRDLERAHQLLAEEVRTPAVEGERRQRVHHRQVADIGAEIRLQAPEADDDRPRHAVLALQFPELRGVVLKQARALLHPVAGDHAVGEFQEALGEDALRAVLAHDGGIVLQAVEGGRNGALGNPLRPRLGLEILEPAAEVAGVAALGGLGPARDASRRGQGSGRHGRHGRQARHRLCQARHRLCKSPHCALRRDVCRRVSWPVTRPVVLEPLSRRWPPQTAPIPATARRRPQARNRVRYRPAGTQDRPRRPSVNRIADRLRNLRTPSPAAEERRLDNKNENGF